jgi:integrase
MTLFALNTGATDIVVSSLRWDREIRVPELGISVFEVPSEHVKGRRTSKVLVRNSVAQSIVDSCRGQHAEFVFVWRRERVRNFDQPAVMSYAPIETMNNTAWKRARVKAGLGDLHVHDPRHTVGMRLRGAGVRESTIADVLWHSRPSITHHCSVAQLVELHAALEGIREATG